MSTEQEREKIKQAALEKRKRFMEKESRQPVTKTKPEGPGRFQRFLGSAPLNWDQYAATQATQTGLSFHPQLDFPKHFPRKPSDQKPISGELQQFAKVPTDEEKDFSYFRFKHKLPRQAEYLGSKGLSFLANLGHTLTYGKLPGAPEGLDPSGKTEIGARVEARLDEFRKANGRNPNLSEKYALMKDEQDVWEKEKGTDDFSRIRKGNEITALVGSIAIEGVGIGALSKAAKATRAANAAKTGVARGVGIAVEKALDAAPATDRLFGAVVGNVLKGGWWTAKTGVSAPVKISKGVASRAVDRFRIKAQEEKLPLAISERKAGKEVQDLLANNKIDIKLGEKFTAFDNSSINNPKKVTPRPRVDKETADKEAKKETFFGLDHPEAVSLRTGDIGVMEGSLSLIKNSFKKLTNQPVEEQDVIRLKKLAGALQKKLIEWKNRAFDQSESINYLKSVETGYTIAFMEKYFSKIFKFDIASDGYKGSYHFNIKGRTPIKNNDDGFYSDDEIFTETVDNINPTTGEAIQRDLMFHKTADAGFGDVIKQLTHPHFSVPLKGERVIVDNEMIRNFGGKGLIRREGGLSPEEIYMVFGKKAGDDISAYELLEKISTTNGRFEGDLIARNLSGGGLGQHTDYRGGSSHFHTGVYKVDVRNAKNLQENKNLDLINYSQQQTEKEIPTAIFGGDGEGRLRGLFYKNPEVSQYDYGSHVANVLIDEETFNYAVRMAEENKLTHGTLNELIGDRFYKNIGNVTRQVDNLLKKNAENIGNRNLIKSVNKLTSDLKTSNIATRFIRDDSGTIKEIAEKGLSDTKQDFQNYTDSIKKILERKEWKETNQSEIKKLLDGVKRELDNELGTAQKDLSDLADLGFESHYFPVQFRKGIEKAIDETGDFNVDKEGVTQRLLALNTMLRTAGATGDFSMIGIQGASALANDAAGLAKRGVVGKDPRVLNQVPSFVAAKDAARAWKHNGPAIAGEYFTRKTVLAELNGFITPEIAAREGLAILGNTRDLVTNRSHWAIIKKIPLIGRFDKAFSHFGNVLRFEMFEKELSLRMIDTGKTAKQLLDDGDVADIARSMNIITGIGKRNFGGNTGQFMLFAPSYWQSRMKYLLESSKGIAKTAIPGAKLSGEQLILRKYMASLIGMAYTTTITANTLMGEETDIMPYKQNEATGDWQYNSNFMRIHFGDLDITLLGPFDSVLRILLAPVFAGANGLTKAREEGGFDLNKFLGEAPEAIRPLITGPLVSNIIDAGFDEDAIGQRVWSKSAINPETGELEEGIDLLKIGETMAGYFTPFALDDLFNADPGSQSIAYRALRDPERNFKDVGMAGAQLGLSFLGFRSSYESLNEILEEGYSKIADLSPSDERLQKATNMDASELRAFQASLGKSTWQDGQVSLPFISLLHGEQTVDFDDLSNDMKSNIRRMADKGMFSEVFSPEELESILTRVDDRLRNSKGSYAKYKLERNFLIKKEQEALQQLENDFKKGNLKYYDPEVKKMVSASSSSLSYPSTFRREGRRIKQEYNSKRRDLTKKEYYKDIEELFSFSRTSALGKITTADPDIYDYANATYIDKLYYDPIKGTNKLDSIVDYNTGEMNWEKRDVKLTEWAEDMKEKYPFLKQSEINSYMVRIQNASRKDSPELYGGMEEMQDYVSKSNYYDIEKNAIDEVMQPLPVAARQKELTSYRRWKFLTGSDRRQFENQKENLWLKQVNNLTKERRETFFQENPRVEAILRIIGSSKTVEPRTAWGRTIDNILRASEKKPMGEGRMALLFKDLLNEDILLEEIRRKYY